MATRTDTDTIVGVVLIVVGALALLDWIGFGPVVLVAAVVAIIVGILMLAKTVRGSTPMAVFLIVIGALLVAPNWLGSLLGDIIETAAAVLLIILGALKLGGRW